MLVLASQHHANCAFPYSGRVSRSFVHWLILSRKLASDKSGVIHLPAIDLVVDIVMVE